METLPDDVYTIPINPSGGDTVIAWLRGTNAYHVGIRYKAVKTGRRTIPAGSLYEELSTLRSEAIEFHNPDPAYHKVWQLSTPVARWFPGVNLLDFDLLQSSVALKLRTESSPIGSLSDLPIDSIWFASDASDEGNYYPAIVTSNSRSINGSRLIGMQWLGGRGARKHWMTHNSLTAFSVEQVFKVYIKDLEPFKAEGPMVLDSSKKPRYPGVAMKLVNGMMAVEVEEK